MLDEDMKRVVEGQRLGYVASVCPDGTPNLSPKGTVAVWDDEHLVFAHLHSPATVANIEAGNTVVEVNVVDPITRKGYRFKGPAAVHRDGERFESGLAFFHRRSGLEAHRVHAVVLVEVQHAEPLVSPAYDDGTAEEVVIQRSLVMYGLRRVEAPPRPDAPVLRSIVIDTLDARGSAEFWRAVLGYVYRPGDEAPPAGDPDPRGADFVVLVDPSGPERLAFQQVDHLDRPTWPDDGVAQQLHLDLSVPTVEDLVAQHERVQGLGATVLYDRSDHPVEPLYVYADPSGHPFCIFVAPVGAS